MFIITLLLSFVTGFFAPATVPFTPAMPAVEEDNSAKSEKLSWSPSRKLSWEDFKGDPDTENPHHALTAANLALDAKCRNNQLEFQVSCVFLPTQSWSKNKKSEKLLYHEQLHFDLTEVHARLLRQQLQALGSSCDNVQQKLGPTVTAAFAAWKAEQDKFDKSVRHGLNYEAQAEWAANIEQRLKELEAYQ
ncbi:DUF922 domain-containing protein [Pontibacter qinzhouensis]|uniref:DUF922 domain-containing protein n=1 Tax=Pontibacter qinzhouensis TaxID=2603253 RepID=A0A5C8KAX1_9BACT|nr:DUF922 domain-containing protein [Pontibacter qinzhouensis]TXK49837.1 DUF922 domain-containing protein [Pontibacter qinzhouensis]